MSELVRFGVSVDAELLEAFDAMCQKRGYANRSEALRHGIRQALAEDSISTPESPAAGVLTLVYNHHDSDLPGQLTEAQHQAHHAVLATLHVHLDHDHCLEVLTLRGTAGPVRDLADTLRAMRGVQQSSFALVALNQ